MCHVSNLFSDGFFPGLTLITLYVFLSILSVAKCGNITVPPLPTTATLYTAVDFTCEGHGGDLAWTIDGNLITDTVKQERAIASITTNTSNGTISSVLTIVALPINDGIIIVCNIGTDIFDIAHSTPAPFTIRGISPVENVSLDLNSSMLYWSPPSSIPSQYRELLSYIVTITIGTNEPANVSTTNDTSLQLPYLAICDIINATITVTSENYISKGTIITDEYSDCQFTNILKPNISYNNTRGCFDMYFNISVVCNIQVCKNTSIQGYSTSSTVVPAKYPKIQLDAANVSNSMVSYKVSVKDSQSYNFFAKVYNSIGKEINQSNLVNFTTYHVQDVSVYQADGSVRSECRFVYQSIADGCHIKLTTDGPFTLSLNISLNINESNIAGQYITLSVNGIYSITAYDIVNGVITDTPSVQYDDIFQYMDSVTISDITTTPTSTTTDTLPTTSQLLPSSINPSNNTTDHADDVIPVIAGSVTAVVIILIVISIITIGSCIVITKRNNKKKRSIPLNAERAIVRLPHSNNNQYSEVVLVQQQSSVCTNTLDGDNQYRSDYHEYIDNGSGLVSAAIDSGGQQQATSSNNEGGVHANGNCVEQESSFTEASGESNDLLLLPSSNNSNDSAVTAVITGSLSAPYNKDPHVNMEAEFLEQPNLFSNVNNN